MAIYDENGIYDKAPAELMSQDGLVSYTASGERLDAMGHRTGTYTNVRDLVPLPGRQEESGTSTKGQKKPGKGKKMGALGAAAGRSFRGGGGGGGGFDRGGAPGRSSVSDLDRPSQRDLRERTSYEPRWAERLPRWAGSKEEPYNRSPDGSMFGLSSPEVRPFDNSGVEAFRMGERTARWTDPDPYVAQIYNRNPFGAQPFEDPSVPTPQMPTPRYNPAGYWEGR